MNKKIEEIAKENGVKTIYCRTSYSNKALIGLKDWEQVEQLVKEYPYLESCELFVKNGSDSAEWKRFADEPFQTADFFVRAEQIGVYTQNYSPQLADEYAHGEFEMLSSMLGEIEPDKAAAYAKKVAENYKLIDDMSENQILVTYPGDEGIKIFPKTCMDFQDDDTAGHWYIGLIDTTPFCQ